jgi:hypothetical protein
MAPLGGCAARLGATATLGVGNRRCSGGPEDNGESGGERTGGASKRDHDILPPAR